MHVTKDFASGILFILFGLGSALIASDYEFGTTVRMGPGFFPILLGGLIVLLGLVVLIGSLISPNESETIATINPRPVFFVSLAIAGFGLLIERAGLAAALFALVLISSFASKERRLWELALIYVTLTAVVWAIFLKLLEVRIPMVAW
jgi:vacuolar-type H+-ATPase subunit I/STV1